MKSQSLFGGDMSFIARDTNLATGDVEVIRDKGEDGIATKHTDRHRFKELAVPRSDHRPDVAVDADWSEPPLLVESGGQHVSVRAAIWQHRIYLRAQGVVDVSLLRTQGTKTVAPVEVSSSPAGAPRSVLAVYWCRDLGVEEQRRTLDHLPKVKLGLMARDAGVLLDVRVVRRPGWATLETFERE